MGQGSSGFNADDEGDYYAQQDQPDNYAPQAEDRASTRLDSPDFQLPAPEAPDPVTVAPETTPAPSEAEPAGMVGMDSPQLAQAFDRLQTQDQGPGPLPGYEDTYLKAKARDRKNLFGYLHQQGVQLEQTPDGEQVIASHPDGSPKFRAQLSKPFQDDSGRWVKQHRDERGQVSNIDLLGTRQYHTDPQTGDQFIRDDTGAVQVIGRDDSVIQRRKLIAARQNLGQQNDADRIAIQSLQSTLQEPLAAYHDLAGSSVEMDDGSGGVVRDLERKVRNLSSGVKPGDTEGLPALELKSATDALAKFREQHPEYDGLKSSIDAGKSEIGRRRQLIQGREAARLLLATRDNGPEVAALLPKEALQGAVSDGEVSGDDLETLSSADVVDKGSTHVQALRKTLASLQNAGVTTVGGVPIGDAISQAGKITGPKAAEPEPAKKNAPSFWQNFIASALTTTAKSLDALGEGAARLVGATDFADKAQQERKWLSEIESGQISEGNPFAPGGQYGDKAESQVDPARQHDFTTGVARVIPQLGEAAIAMAAPMIGVPALIASGAADTAAQAGDEGKNRGIAALKGGAKSAVTLKAFGLAGELAGSLTPAIASSVARGLAAAGISTGVNALADATINKVFGGDAIPQTPAEWAERGLFALFFGLHSGHESYKLPERIQLARAQIAAIDAAKEQAQDQPESLAEMDKRKGAVEKWLGSQNPKLIAKLDETAAKAIDEGKQAASSPAPQENNAKDLTSPEPAKAAVSGPALPSGSTIHDNLTRLQDLQGKLSDARAENDHTAVATLKDEATALHQQVRAASKVVRESLSPELRNELAKKVDPALDAESLDKAVSANGGFHLASVGRQLRGAYLSEGREQSLASTFAKAGGDEPLAQHTVDQHVGQLAAKDLAAVARGGTIEAGKAAALEQEGLLEHHFKVPGDPNSGTEMRLTDDALPLLPRGLKEQAKNAPQSLKITSTPGSPQDVGSTHLESGQRQFADALSGSRQVEAKPETLHQVRVHFQAADGSDVQRVIPVKAESKEAAFLKAVHMVDQGGRKMISAGVEDPAGRGEPEREFGGTPVPAVGEAVADEVKAPEQPAPIEPKAEEPKAEEPKAPIEQPKPAPKVGSEQKMSDLSTQERRVVGTVAKGFALNKKLFAALGVRGIKLVHLGEDTSGMMIQKQGDTSILFLDGKALKGQFDIFAQSGTKSTDWVSYALNEEIIHVAQFGKCEKLGKTPQKYYGDLFPHIPAELLAKAGEVYTDFDKLEPWQQAAEAERMIVQKGWIGTITEKLFDAIKDTLDYLKGLKVEKSPLLEQAVKQTEAVLAEAQKQVDASRKAEADRIRAGAGGTGGESPEAAGEMASGEGKETADEKAIRKFRENLRKDRAEEKARQDALPIAEQSPGTWVFNEAKKIAPTKGLSPLEALQDYRKELKLQWMHHANEALKKNEPIHREAFEESPALGDLGFEVVPKGYKLKGDVYVYEAPKKSRKASLGGGVANEVKAPEQPAPIEHKAAQQQSELFTKTEASEPIPEEVHRAATEEIASIPEETVQRIENGSDETPERSAPAVFRFASHVRLRVSEFSQFAAHFANSLGQSGSRMAQAMWRRTNALIALTLALHASPVHLGDFHARAEAREALVERATPELERMKGESLKAVEEALTPPSEAKAEPAKEAPKVEIAKAEAPAPDITAPEPDKVGEWMKEATTKERKGKVGGSIVEDRPEYVDEADAAKSRAANGESLSAVDVAWTFYGEQEGENPHIQKVLDLFGSKLSQDKYPWCAPFVSFTLAKSGESKFRSQSARSFLKAGERVSLDAARKGDVAVLWNDEASTGGRDGWGGHVGFVLGKEGHFLRILGGNQSDGVNVIVVHESRVLGVRRMEATKATAKNSTKQPGLFASRAKKRFGEDQPELFNPEAGESHQSYARRTIADLLKLTDQKNVKEPYVVSTTDGEIEEVFDSKEMAQQHMSTDAMRGHWLWHANRASGKAELLGGVAEGQPDSAYSPREGAVYGGIAAGAQTKAEAGALPRKTPFGFDFKGQSGDVTFYGEKTGRREGNAVEDAKQPEPAAIPEKPAKSDLQELADTEDLRSIQRTLADESQWPNETTQDPESGQKRSLPSILGAIKNAAKDGNLDKAKEGVAYLAKLGSNSETFDKYAIDLERATSRVAEESDPLRPAYDALVKKSGGFPAVSIGELAKESGRPLEEVKGSVLAAHKRGEAVLSQADWSLANEATRAGAVEAGGDRFTQVRFLPKEGLAASKAKGSDAQMPHEDAAAHDRADASKSSSQEARTIGSYWDYFTNHKSHFAINGTPFVAELGARESIGGLDGRELLIENIRTGYGEKQDAFGITGTMGTAGARKFFEEARIRALALVKSLPQMGTDFIMVRSNERSRTVLYGRVFKEITRLFPDGITASKEGDDGSRVFVYVKPASEFAAKIEPDRMQNAAKELERLKFTISPDSRALDSGAQTNKEKPSLAASKAPKNEGETPDLKKEFGFRDSPEKIQRDAYKEGRSDQREIQKEKVADAREAERAKAQEAKAEVREKMKERIADLRTVLSNSVSKAAAYKEVLRKAQAAGKAGRDAGSAEMKATLNQADRWLEADARKIRDDLVATAKDLLPQERQGRFLEAITKATERPSLLHSDPTAMYKRAGELVTRMQDYAHELHKKEVIDEIREALKHGQDSPSVDINYKAKLKAIESRYSFVRLSEAKRAELQSRRDFLRRQQLNGNASGIPAAELAELKRLTMPHISELPTDALEALRDRVDRLTEQGRLTVKLREQAYTRERESREQALTNEKTTPFERRRENADLPPLKPGEKSSLTIMQRLQNQIGRAWDQAKVTGDRALMPIDAAFDILGQAKGTYSGWLFRHLRGPIDLAYNESLQAMKEVNTRLDSLITKHKLTKGDSRRIGTYAIAQQEGGRERLIAMGIPEERIKAVEDSFTPGEHEIYVEMRKTMDSMYPKLRETMRQLYNTDVPAVSQYFPMARDWKEYQKDAELPKPVDPSTGEPVGMDELATWKYVVEDVSPKTRTSVDKGFTNERLDGAKTAVKIDAFDVYRRHMQDVLHLLNTQRHLKMAGEIMRSPLAQEKFGRAGRQMVLDWLDTIARNGGVESFKRIQLLDTLRKMSSVGMIAFRVSSTFKHASNAALAIPHVGPVWYLKALSRVLTNESQAFLAKNFAETFAREGGEQAIEEVSKTSKFARAGFWGIRQIDRLDAQSAALGYYMRALAEKGLDPEKFASLPIDKEAQQDALVRMRRIVASPHPKDAPQVLSRGAGLGGNVSFSRTIFQFGNIFLERWSNVRHDLFNGIKNGEQKRAALAGVGLLAAIAAESGIVMGIRSAANAVTGHKDKEEHDFEGEMFHEALRQIPFMNQLLSMALWKRSGIAAIDAPVQVAADAGSAFRAPTPTSRAKNAVSAAGGAASILGVPGAGQVTDLIKKSIHPNETEVQRVMREKGIAKPESHAKDRKEIIAQLRDKKITPAEAVAQARGIGLAPAQVKTLTKTAAKDPSIAEFEHLPLKTAIEVFRAADIEQKRKWFAALQRKHAAARLN